MESICSGSLSCYKRSYSLKNDSIEFYWQSNDAGLRIVFSRLTVPLCQLTSKPLRHDLYIVERQSEYIVLSLLLEYEASSSIRFKGRDQCTGKSPGPDSKRFNSVTELDNTEK